MNEEERIDYLNTDILKNKKKIKNLQIRDDIVAITTGFTIIIGINLTCFIKVPSCYTNGLFYPILTGSLLLGIIPSVSLPTYKTMKKATQYRLNIKNDINELHEIALEENKRIEKVKKK